MCQTTSIEVNKRRQYCFANLPVGLQYLTLIVLGISALTGMVLYQREYSCKECLELGSPLL